jgi:large subunit ribosomal protein L15
MFDLSNIGPNRGAVRRRKRVGRGPGSGLGKTAGRGHKGQKSRSGGAKPAYFEGGQIPISRRLPKRGFTNIFKVTYQAVNVGQLEEKFEPDSIIDKEALKKAGLIKKLGEPVKLLGRGSVSKKFTVKVDAASKKAIEIIQSAGGTVEVTSK